MADSKSRYGSFAMGSGGRRFENRFPEFGSESAALFLNATRDAVSDRFGEKLVEYEEDASRRLTSELGAQIFGSDCAFAGSAGLALLHYLRSKRDPKNARSELIDAAKYVQIRASRHPRVTFLCGEPGPIALGIVIGDRLGNDRPSAIPEPNVLVQRLETLWKVARQAETPDELLYGRTGYLYSLLFVNKETGKSYIPSSLITKVIECIFQSGQNLSSQPGMRWKTPLLYEWHDSFYLGAAHGTAGILYMMLQARQYVTADQMNNLVKPTLDWLLSLRYENGNLPSSLGSRTDRLVQWCHGAPGLVQLCCLAYEVFKDEQYMVAALKCGEVVWARGLCTKGYSICHGVAGNAYTFLQLYQATKDSIQLYRACCFADWCIEEKPGTEQHSPDAPASLFEGLAGRLYLIADIMNPLQAKFPAYTL